MYPKQNIVVRDGPLENLWGGGGRGGEGAGEVQKKYSREGKCTPINPNKYSCYGLKKIHSRNLITKKKFVGLENSPPCPPITFLMARPLFTSC